MAEASSDSGDFNLSVSLSCESSSYGEDFDNFLKAPTVAPYQFEPYLDSDTEDPTEQDDYDDGNSDNSWLNNTDWYYYKFDYTLFFF